MIPNNSAPIIDRQQPEAVHYMWLDVVRLLAMAMVAVHHLSSIHNEQFLADWDLGALGVSLFYTLSGFLAAPKSRSCSLSAAMQWFRRRYVRLMPAYWLTLVAVLLANQFVNYKPVTAGLIASEFLGIHWYTHGSAIIGIHFWFISLILTCYCLTIAVRFNHRFLYPLLLISAAAVYVQPSFSMHILTYLVGMEIGLKTKPLHHIVMFVVLIVLGIFVKPAFLYPASAVIVLFPLRFMTASSSGFSKPLATWSHGTYEFYLVHGPVYLGFAHLRGFGILANATMGTGVAIICAFALRQMIVATESCSGKRRASVAGHISDGRKISDA